MFFEAVLLAVFFEDVCSFVRLPRSTWISYHLSTIWCSRARTQLIYELVANHSNHRSRSSRVSSWVRRKNAEKGQTQGVGWRGLVWLGVAWEDWEGRWRMKHDWIRVEPTIVETVTTACSRASFSCQCWQRANAKRLRNSLKFNATPQNFCLWLSYAFFGLWGWQLALEGDAILRATISTIGRDRCRLLEFSVFVVCQAQWKLRLRVLNLQTASQAIHKSKLKQSEKSNEYEYRVRSYYMTKSLVLAPCPQVLFLISLVQPQTLGPSALLSGALEHNRLRYGLDKT